MRLADADPRSAAKAGNNEEPCSGSSHSPHCCWVCRSAAPPPESAQRGKKAGQTSASWRNVELAAILDRTLSGTTLDGLLCEIVDDDKREIGKGDAFLEEGMRTDEKIDRAVRKSGEPVRSLG